MIVITTEGGIIVNVLNVEGPVDYVVIDWDVDGADESEIDVLNGNECIVSLSEKFDGPMHEQLKTDLLKYLTGALCALVPSAAASSIWRACSRPASAWRPDTP